MTDIGGILRANGKLLDLAKDVKTLEDLAEVVEKWPQVKATLDGLQKSRTLDEWLELLFDKIDSEEVAEIIDKAKIKGLHQRISGWLGKLSDEDRENILLLLRPLSGLEGKPDDIFAFPLVALGKTMSGGDKASWHLSLKGDAKLAFEADGRWPYAKDDEVSSLLVIRASCAGDATARAKLPYQFASLSAEGGTEQSIALDQYFQPADREVPFALCLARSIPQLANPFDFDSAFARLSSPDSDLQGITLDYAGAIYLKVTVGLDKGITNDFVTAGGSVELSVSVRRPAQLSLSLRRGQKLQNDHSVLIAVSRNTAVERDLALKAELKVDASKSAAKLRALMDEGLGKWDKGLETIKPFLSPGTYLQQQLSGKIDEVAAELIGNDGLREALVTDAHVAIGLAASDSSALSAWLVELLQDKVNALAGDLAADAQGAIDRVSESVLSELPTVELLGTSATGEVRVKVEELVQSAQNAFVAEATAIYDGVKDDATKQLELGEELARIGEVSGKAVKQLDDVLEPLRTIIGDIDKSFRSLLKLVEERGAEEFAASLEAEDKKINGRNFEFAGEFTRRTQDAGTLYRSLLVGGYQVVEKQLRGTGICPGFTLDRERTNVGRYAEHHFNWGFKLNLFGLGLSQRSTLSGSARAKLTHDGIVLDLTGKSGRTLTKGKDSRTFDFVTKGRIRRLREVAEGKPSRLSERSLSFVMSYEEDKLEREELEAFADSLVNATHRGLGSTDPTPLLSAEGRAALLAGFAKWVPSPGARASMPASLTLRLSLGADRVVRRLQTPLPPAAELFTTAMQQFAATGAFDVEAWQDFMAHVKKQGSLPLPGPLEAMDYRPMSGVAFPRRDKTRRPGPRGRNKPLISAPGHELVRETALRAQAFADFARLLNTLYALPLSPEGFADEEGAGEVENAISDDIADIVSLGAGSSDSILNFGRVFRFEDGVTARTVSLLQLLHHHFDIDTPLVTVTLRRTGDDSASDHVVVS